MEANFFNFAQYILVSLKHIKTLKKRCILFLKAVNFLTFFWNCHKQVRDIDLGAVFIFIGISTGIPMNSLYKVEKYSVGCEKKKGD